MQVTETNTDGLKREFKIVVAANDIDEKVQARLEEVGQDVKLPGFRPGKVPMGILKQRFGPRVMGEVLERAVQDSSSQAMMERGLRPAVQPKIEITSFDEGKDLEYTMAVELLPEVQPMDFSTLSLERFKVKVPDSEVQEALENLGSSQKKTEPLTEERPAESGDVLVIDFAGTVDGEALPGMAAEDHHLELGSNQFVGTFEEQLVGAKKGEERDVTVTFPENYGNERLAGNDAVFKVTVKDILAAVPLPIDDEMAKRFGAESLDAFKEQVRERIEQEYAGVARARLKRELLDKLSEAHDFPVPEGMVEAEFHAIWHQIEDDKKAGRLDPEDEGKSEEDLKEEYRKIAERRVRLGLLLSEVGRQNSIDVAQEEVNQALLREAQRYPGQEREVFEYYQKTPEALANLRAPIFEDKVIDYIVELAQVTDKELSPDELRKEMGIGEPEEGAEGSQDEGEKPKKKGKAKAKKAESEAEES